MGITRHFRHFRTIGTTTAILISAGLLSGCAEISLLGHAASEMKSSDDTDLSKVNRGSRKVGKPYKVDNIWYYPAEDPQYSETGIASWYGEPFHGRKTANGAVYDMNQLTAAHKTLPMPTDVRVTNLENGRSLVVTVNDRGPFVHGRIIDLSRRAAQLLGVIRNGTAKVRVELANPAGQDVRYLAKAETTEEEKKKVKAAPKADVQTATLAPPSDVKAAPKPDVAELPKPADTLNETTPTPAVPDNVLSVEPVADSEIFIQAGAFIDFNNANRLSAQLSGLAPTKVNQVLVNGQDFYRVRLGPVYSVDEADILLAKLINSGHTNARIIIEQQ
ncbi:septal ring lytic transglycosylase RlpA family protein [Sneathiella sp.]|jgi:rare lipoprotein A|uniref:septal ring lytic transglycosylase RlpA family protein n=1 Tax=Sneathiella sp. TaxID=1964365 RepID=UPI0039E6E1A0